MSKPSQEGESPPDVKHINKNNKEIILVNNTKENSSVEPSLTLGHKTKGRNWSRLWRDKSKKFFYREKIYGRKSKKKFF